MYYTDEKTTYRRVVGGIAWPGDLPGFAVVIGEEIYPAAFESKNHHLYVLAEVEETDVYQLFKRCTELTVKYNISCFYGRRDGAMINVLNLWFHDAWYNKRAFFGFDSAPFSKDDNISYHMNVVKSLLQPERKFLHLQDVIKKPKLPAHIQSLPLSAVTEQGSPHVAALGYAVTSLLEYGYIDCEEKEEEVYDNESVNEVTGY